MKEKTIKTNSVYHSNFLTIVEDEVLLTNQRISKRIVVKHSGASAILPITKDGHLVLVKQYRYPINQVTIEVPAGKLNEGEDPLLCALRECEEEAQIRPERTKHIYSIHNCLGYSDEIIHLYIGYGAEVVKDPLEKDPDEFFEINHYTKKEVRTLLESHQVT
ncbi:MAG: NUDIX domain-containing protein, partial [Acholeplasmataceae bacterium]